MDGKTKGIIIRTTDYRESDRILDVFTPEGIVAVVAKGVRSPSAKLKNLSNIFTYGEYIFQDGRGRKVLMGGEIVENFFPCWTDPKKYASAMICLEIVEKLFGRAEETQEDFVALLKCLKEIAYGEAPLATALWFCVVCARRTGCDYGVVSEFDPDVYQLLCATADGTETGVVGAREIDLFSAIKALGVCFKNDFNIQLTYLREAEKLFYKLQ